MARSPERTPGETRVSRRRQRLRRREAAGAVRPRRDTAHRSATDAGDVRAPRAERPAGAGDARPPQLLEQRLPADPERAARAISEASVAGRSLDRDADAPNVETL